MTDDLAARVEHLRSLRDDWDGYGADAPSWEALHTAVDAANLGRDRHQIEPATIMPSAEGGAILVYTGAPGRAEIEYGNDRSVFLVWTPEGGSADVVEYQCRRCPIHDAAHRLKGG